MCYTDRMAHAVSMNVSGKHAACHAGGNEAFLLRRIATVANRKMATLPVRRQEQSKTSFKPTPPFITVQSAQPTASRRPSNLCLQLLSGAQRSGTVSNELCR